MKIVPVYIWDKLPIRNERDRLIAGPEQPVLRKLIEQRGIKLRTPQEKHSNRLERILVESRVLIIEGISGSGKDTFQAYLRKKLNHRDVYDYSEGELLHSWKHFPIEGILKLRVKFLKLFVTYIKKTVLRDNNSVFLLNRFHLSAYLSTILRQPELQKEYDEIITVLKTLPTHIFVLQVDESEIVKRSSHLERSSAWRKLQQQMLTQDGFVDRLGRYSSQQKLIFEAAEKQQIPYSILKIV